MKGVKPHFEIVEGTRDCSLGAAGTNGLMSRGQGNLLAFGGRTESDTTSNLAAAAAAAVRGLRFFLSYTMELREPLVLPQGSRLNGSCEGPLRIPLQSMKGPRSLSRVVAGTSGFLFSAGSQGTYGVSTGESGLVSFGVMEVRLLLELSK